MYVYTYSHLSGAYLLKHNIDSCSNDCSVCSLSLSLSIYINIYFVLPAPSNPPHTWNFCRSNSATLLNNLNVTVAKLRHGAGIGDGCCPSTLDDESGGNNEPYNIETQPNNSVPCNVPTRCVGSDSSGQWWAKATRKPNAANKNAQAGCISCTGPRTDKQQYANCSTTPTQTEKL